MGRSINISGKKRQYQPQSGIQRRIRPPAFAAPAIADLTIFDPATIRGNATVENPNQFSSGIEMVIVNGKEALKDGKLLAKNGSAIKAS